MENIRRDKKKKRSFAVKRLENKSSLIFNEQSSKSPVEQRSRKDRTASIVLHLEKMSILLLKNYEPLNPHEFGRLVVNRDETSPAQYAATLSGYKNLTSVALFL